MRDIWRYISQYKFCIIIILLLLYYYIIISALVGASRKCISHEKVVGKKSSESINRSLPSFVLCRPSTLCLLLVRKWIRPIQNVWELLQCATCLTSQPHLLLRHRHVPTWSAQSMGTFSLIHLTAISTTFVCKMRKASGMLR